MENSHNRRLDRRIPLGAAARIQLDDCSDVQAHCIELSVTGLTLVSNFVPAENEILEVFIDAFEGPVQTSPLHARIEVKRCVEISPGQYEFGGRIVEILA